MQVHVATRQGVQVEAKLGAQLERESVGGGGLQMPILEENQRRLRVVVDGHEPSAVLTET